MVDMECDCSRMDKEQDKNTGLETGDEELENGDEGEWRQRKMETKENGDKHQWSSKWAMGGPLNSEEHNEAHIVGG
ncbi:hypothetical protein DPX16_13817 [Anabarilius grahami]|uniref:Uncharacterized protein n=1 Tax=Anabarilius grahami TaxID=495550 RepID=A0A3N0XTJ1_ANAGA|nr:hypothetical protein DPX16_13817 [Anabarilius grahami]